MGLKLFLADVCHSDTLEKLNKIKGYIDSDVPQTFRMEALRAVERKRKQLLRELKK